MPDELENLNIEVAEALWHQFVGVATNDQELAETAASLRGSLLVK